MFYIRTRNQFRSTIRISHGGIFALRNGRSVPTAPELPFVETTKSPQTLVAFALTNCVRSTFARAMLPRSSRARKRHRRADRIVGPSLQGRRSFSRLFPAVPQLHTLQTLAKLKCMHDPENARQERHDFKLV